MDGDQINKAGVADYIASQVADETDAPGPPFPGSAVLLGPSVGTGKTREAQRVIARELANGKRVLSVNTTHRVVDQNLADQRDFLRLAGTNVEIGKYEAPDNTDSVSGDAACLQLGKMEAISDAGGDRELACFDPKTGDTCSDFDNCRWAAIMFPEVVPPFMAVPMGVVEHPIGPHADRLWDLALWDDATGFVTQKYIPLAGLKKAAARITDAAFLKERLLKTEALPYPPEELGQYARQMAAVAEAIFDAIDRAKTEDRRLSITRGGLPGRARIANLRQMLRFAVMLRPHDARPNPTEDQLKRWKTNAEDAEDLWEVIRFLDMLGRCVSKAAPTGEVPGFWLRVSNEGLTYIDMSVIIRPHKSLRDARTRHLLCSATFPELLARVLFEKVEVLRQTRWPSNPLVSYIRVRHERGFSMKSLVIPRGGEHDRPKLTALGEAVVRWINTKAAEFEGTNPTGPGDVLVGTTKALAQLLVGGEHKDADGETRTWPRLVAENVAVISSKAAEGSNDFKGVRCQITLSRSQPTPGQIVTVAEAYKGAPIPLGEDAQWRYRDVVELPGTLPLRDPYHEDEYLDAVLRNECHGSTIQMDRLRHVRRDVECEVWLLHDLPTQQPVTEHVEWADLDCWFTTCAQRHGVVPDVLTNGADIVAAALMSERFRDARAVLDHRKARVEDLGETPEVLMALLPFENPYRLRIKMDPEGKSRERKTVIVEARNYRTAVRKIKAALGDVWVEARATAKSGMGPMRRPTDED